MKNYNPQAAWEAQQRRQRVKRLADEFARMGAPVEGLGSMAAQADTLMNNLGPMSLGGDQHRLYMTAKAANDNMMRRGSSMSDPAGNAVRKLLPERDTSLDPMVNNLPNKAYGEAYGLEWDGQQWVKANPNADLERQAMELELEKRRQDMEQAKYGGGPDSAIAAWLSKRMGG